MSGIVGVYYLDGRPVDRADLERMANILAHRGPDDAGIWSQGSVGLGHRMLWTTPESLQEKLPLTHQTGHLVITADARIDNQAELLPLLGFSDRPAGEVADSQLILAAYEKWGEQCPEKLIGDFAFAIWDGRRQVLFCARDHFGIRPFYYYYSPQTFVFGSEIKALLSLPEVPQRLNELRIGYHLAVTVEDKAITFYQDVFRLPSGHSMTVSARGIQMRTYWSLDPKREIRFESDEAYAEAFRELFIEAVRCRLRSAFPVGSMLSGGLDSSAVTCVARDLLAKNNGRPLHTVSAIFEEFPQCNERPYIQKVVAGGGILAQYISLGQVGPLADLKRIFQYIDEPFAAPTFYIIWNLYQAAQQQGVRVILDGIDGDTAVYHGDMYLAELARASQWEKFVLEAKAIARHENLPSVPVLFEQYGWPYLTELAQGWQWLTLIKEINELSPYIGTSRRKILQYCGFEPAITQPVRQAWRKLNHQNNLFHTVPHIAHQNFAERISLNNYLETLENHRSIPSRTARDEHYSLLIAGLMTYVFELTDGASMAFSIESRHPFADRRLLEFCLALPSDQKLRQGWNRFILRRALGGLLPEEIRWRGGKTVNRAVVTSGLLDIDGRLLKEVIADSENTLSPYVDGGALHEVYSRYLSDRQSTDEMKVWQAVVLALWLRGTHLAL